MDSPKKNPAIQYKTKFALHNVPVSPISQYWTTSKPNGLKNRAIIMQRVARLPIRIFLQVSTVTVHSHLFFHETPNFWIPKEELNLQAYLLPLRLLTYLIKGTMKVFEASFCFKKAAANSTLNKRIIKMLASSTKGHSGLFFRF